MKVVEETVLDEITRRLVRTFEPEQVILFGSHAWGAPNDDSDVDILVIVADSGEPLIDRCQRGHECLEGLDVSKDVLVRTRAEVDLFRDVYTSLECRILEQGKVLYDRRKVDGGTVLADSTSCLSSV